MKGLSEFLAQLRIDECFIMPLETLSGSLTAVPSCTAKCDRQMILMKESAVMGNINMARSDERMQRSGDQDIIFPALFARCMCPSGRLALVKTSVG